MHANLEQWLNQSKRCIQPVSKTGFRGAMIGYKVSSKAWVNTKRWRYGLGSDNWCEVACTQDGNENICSPVALSDHFMRRSDEIERGLKETNKKSSW